MDLSAETLDGLQLIGDSSFISDKVFSLLATKTCESLLDKSKKNDVLDSKDLETVDGGIIKQAHASLVTLLIEASRQDQDFVSISHVLEDCKFTSDRISTLETIYKEYKPEIQVLLSSTANYLPHIVDVDWRLDYYIKNNYIDKANKPTFLINLKAQNGSLGDSGTSKDIQFACTQEQLQILSVIVTDCHAMKDNTVCAFNTSDLVGKLKDACKTMERASQI